MTIDARSSAVRVPKAGELVAAKLRRQIVTGELRPGEPLPTETVLMERFGVSRPSLREAVRILESESIITVLRGARGGARVMAPDGAVAARYTGLLLQYRAVPLADVYQARTALEVSCVGMLAHASVDRIDELSRLVEAGAALLEDAVGFAQHNTRVHQAVVDLAGNQMLSVLAGMLWHIIDAHNALFMSVHGEAHERQADRVALRAHRKLVELLRVGDSAVSQAFWHQHLDKVEKYMVGDSNTTLVEVLS